MLDKIPDVISQENDSTFQTGKTAIEKFVQAANAYVRYDRQPRHYGTEDTLFMSEAYFIQAAAVCEKPEIGRIAEMLNVTAGAASQTAAKLEAKGLISRTRSSEDSRVVLVHLSEQSKKLNAYHDELDRREFKKFGYWMKTFSEEETAVIYRFLDMVGVFFEDNPEEVMKDWKYPTDAIH